MKKKLNNKRGFTLVEMVVTFALLAIFSVTMVNMITSSLSIYASSNLRTDAMGVSEIVMDKVSGEIEGAQCAAADEAKMTISRSLTGNDDEYLQFADNTCISFSNRTGSPIYITLGSGDDEGHLLIHYRPVINYAGKLIKPVDWTFDKAVYKGFKIDYLNFEIVNVTGADNKSYKTNVIKIKMRVSKEGYKYDTEKYVECYNFKSITDLEKISNGYIETDRQGI